MKQPIRNFLVVSGHDFRSKRKANVHFISEELSQLGQLRFFSLGFSFLSDLKGRDPRCGLKLQQNRVEVVRGAECFLWRSLFHPFNLRINISRWLSAAPFLLYKRMLPRMFYEWVKQSDVVMVESGIAVIILDLIKKINPQIKIVYLASDDLGTVGVSPYLISALNLSAHQIDLIRVPSKFLVEKMPAGPKCIVIEHGVDPNIVKYTDPSPYHGGINAVSVGTMLFDPLFFHIACGIFPEIKFHVIGSGCRRDKLPSAVVYYDEMRFEDTIKYIKHADFGIAPYKLADVPLYLADTSMKLIQFNFLGLYAICPHFAVGQNSESRIGYVPGDRASITAAIQKVLTAGKPKFNRQKDWHEVTLNILNEI